MSFYLTMCLYPDVMRKAQSEIDKITKAKRLPTLEDRNEIPYIDALVKELYRYVTRISELGGQRTYQQGF